MNGYLSLLGALTRAELNFVVVGGTAAVLHGASTATYDLDILIRFDRASCTSLVAAISGLHPRYAHLPDHPVMQRSADELTAFRNLYLLTDLGRLDVLGELPPIDDVGAVMQRASPMDVGGVTVRVIAIEDLIRVKASMGRPKDKQTELELRALLSAR